MPSASIMPLVVWGVCGLAALYAVDFLLTRRYGKEPQDPAQSAAKEALFAAAYSAIPAFFALILWLHTKTFELLVIAQIITAISCAGALWHFVRSLFSRLLAHLPRALLAGAAAISALCCAFITNRTDHYTLRFSSECPRPVMYHPSPVLPLFPTLGDVESGSFGIVVPPGDITMDFDGNTVSSVTPDVVTVMIDENCEADVLNVKIRIRI